MSSVRLVAQRELVEAFRARSYWVTMLVLLLAVAASIVLPRLLDGEDAATVGVVGDVPAALREQLVALAEATDREIEVVAVPDRGRAERQVRDEDLDAAVAFEGERPSVLRRDGAADEVVALAAQAAVTVAAQERLLDAGLSPAEATEVLAGPAPREVVVDGEDDSRSGVAYAVSFALYLAIMMGGMGVATGVAVEKSTHVAELLVTIVRPTHLLAGKVLGIGLSTLLLLLAGAVPFALAVLGGWSDAPTAAVADVLGGVGWFVLGYAVYAIAFAALGALVDRQEDLPGAVAPMTVLLVLSFFAGVQALDAPDGTVATVTSLIPFSAPLVMPARIAQGAASTAEVVAAVALAVVVFLVLARVGGTVYRRALLRGGRRLKLGEVLRG